MKYPVYDESLGSRTHPLDELVHLYADRELMAQKVRRKRATWSMHIGELCLAQKQRNYGHVSAVMRSLPEGSVLSPIHDALVNMIFYRGHEELVKEQQQKLHSLSATSLKVLLKSKDRLLPQAFFGAVAENTALCLLTRYVHPWMIASPVLPHHEIDSGIKDKYDLVVAIDDGNTNSGHYLQVKAGCTSRCGRRPSNFIITDRYAPEIQFVSGCCDLGLFKDKYTNPEPSAAGLLIAEYYETATTAEVKRLDELTDNLIFNMTANLLPRGTSI